MYINNRIKKEKINIFSNLSSNKGDEYIQNYILADTDNIQDRGSGDSTEISPGMCDVQVVEPAIDYTPIIIKNMLDSLSERWRNYTVRCTMTCLMVGIFSFLVYVGPMALVALVLMIQLMSFNEIINIGYIVYRSQDLPWFRSLSWFFVFSSNYFFFGEGLIDNFKILLEKKNLWQCLVAHHRFISFCLYCCGVVLFVLSLVKKHYLQQFSLFGWTHVILLLLVTSTHFIMNNIFNGIIWFLVPVSMIICNDCMAYMFGFFFGRTPLIKLSPKKTWEGFIGGGLSTVVFSLILSMFLVQNDYFVCPLKYDGLKGTLSMDCVRNPVFRPVIYQLPSYFSFTFFRQITLYPYFKHCMIMAIFSSVVGPFGGFFASGFKRAFKVKDFSDIIPGHGGVMDRTDCQFLMGTFVYLYYNSFIRVSSPNSLLYKILNMPSNDQLEFYQILTDSLIRRGILP